MSGGLGEVTVGGIVLVGFKSTQKEESMQINTEFLLVHLVMKHF